MDFVKCFHFEKKKENTFQSLKAWETVQKQCMQYIVDQ